MRGSFAVSYYAHTIEDAPENEWHTLKDHLIGTARLAAAFAKTFDAEALGWAAGILHDIGKYSCEFQKRLRGAPIRVDHSTAGAQEAVQLYGDNHPFGRLLAYVIAGHHSGLPDFGSPVDDISLVARLKKPVPAYGDYRREIDTSFAFEKLIKLPVRPIPKHAGFSVQFFVRMLFSCLVDADFLDTESAVNPAQARVRGGYPHIDALVERLENYLSVRFGRVEKSPINTLRGEILDNCRKSSQLPCGFYSLTVPTGGGKTLSSLTFALHHAKKHRLDRVIYVIPFTSIIEQNAQVFRTALGHDCVLEHHSNFQFADDAADDEDVSSTLYRLRLSAENWDAPVIVTTNVQFFESLFSHKSSRCRKLHHIANSVVVLDEAQMIPTPFLLPCLWALYELVQNYNSSVLLCTATQPSIGHLLPKAENIREIVPDPPKLYEAFRRVRVRSIGDMDDDMLTDRLSREHQVLCIVNTRSHAAALYERIRGDGAYHLSARMYPAHRSEKLRRIRIALEQNQTCRVVATQLIEAGVDVDFPVVYRAIAGVDSIAQAAGRCNREGRLANGDVFVFRPEARHQPKGWFQRTATITDMVLRHHDDLLSLEAIDDYFRRLYDFEGERLDEHSIIDRFSERAAELAFPFREVGEIFQLIDSPMVSIVIPREEECIKTLEEAMVKGPTLDLSRRLQPFIVQIYRHEFAELARANAIEAVAEQYTVLTDHSRYDDEVGLIPGDSSLTTEPLIF